MMYQCSICDRDLVWIEAGAVCLESHGPIMHMNDHDARDFLLEREKRKRRVAEWSMLPEAVKVERRGCYLVNGEVMRKWEASDRDYRHATLARLPDTAKKTLRKARFVLKDVPAKEPT